MVRASKTMWTKLFAMQPLLLWREKIGGKSIPSRRSFSTSSCQTFGLLHIGSSFYKLLFIMNVIYQKDLGVIEINFGNDSNSGKHQGVLTQFLDNILPLCAFFERCSRIN